MKSEEEFIAGIYEKAAAYEAEVEGARILAGRTAAGARRSGGAVRFSGAAMMLAAAGVALLVCGTALARHAWLRAEEGTGTEHEPTAYRMSPSEEDGSERSRMIRQETVTLRGTVTALDEETGLVWVLVSEVSGTEDAFSAALPVPGQEAAFLLGTSASTGTQESLSVGTKLQLEGVPLPSQDFWPELGEFPLLLIQEEADLCVLK